jgi:hypothetical protein
MIRYTRNVERYNTIISNIAIIEAIIDEISVQEREDIKIDTVDSQLI